MASSFVREGLCESRDLLDTLLEDTLFLESLEKAIYEMAMSLKEGGTLYSCGNGGSFCDAMHFAEELSGRFCKDRPPLRAMSFSDGGHLTCTANDYGYDAVFERAIGAYGRMGDVMLAISTSGNSLNIIKAVEAAHQLKVKTVGLLGKEGGQLKDLVDIALVVPSSVTHRIQEIHIKVIHLFIEGIERILYPHLYEKQPLQS